jgi:hypothetical protein
MAGDSLGKRTAGVATRTLISATMILVTVAMLWLSGCSSVGPGLANHPIDCAVGYAWADCRPDTPGYKNYMAGVPLQVQINKALRGGGYPSSTDTPSQSVE